MQYAHFARSHTLSKLKQNQTKSRPKWTWGFYAFAITMQIDSVDEPKICDSTFTYTKCSKFIQLFSNTQSDHRSFVSETVCALQISQVFYGQLIRTCFGIFSLMWTAKSDWIFSDLELTTIVRVALFGYGTGTMDQRFFFVIASLWWK